MASFSQFLQFTAARIAARRGGAPTQFFQNWENDAIFAIQSIGLQKMASFSLTNLSL
jgi:hypothetical protein